MRGLLADLLGRDTVPGYCSADVLGLAVAIVILVDLPPTLDNSREIIK